MYYAFGMIYKNDSTKVVWNMKNNILLVVDTSNAVPLKMRSIFFQILAHDTLLLAR